MSTVQLSLAVAIETIDPAQASAILAENNSRNRKLSPSRVDQLALAMSRGEWVLNGESLKFNGDGALLDGQHRLAAVVKSGETQQFLVVRGLDHETLETIDIGRSRTFGDMLAIEGEGYHINLAAAIRAVWAYERIGVPYASVMYRQPTPSQLKETLERHPELRLSINAGGHTNSVFALTRSQVMTLHYLMSRVDQDAADEFWTKVATGIGLGQSDPAYILRERLMREQQIGTKVGRQSAVLMAFAIRAFNAYRSGETITRLLWRPGRQITDSFPRLENCPMRGELLPGVIVEDEITEFAVGEVSDD